MLVPQMHNFELGDIASEVIKQEDHMALPVELSLFLAQEKATVLEC